MGWGLLIGWEGVFSRFLLRSLLQASKAAAEDRSCGRRGGEEEQGIPLVDLVVISFICGGLFVSSGCNILLKNFLDTYLFRFEEEFSGFGITFFRFRGWGRGAE